MTERKRIIVDIMNETAEMKIVAKGFVGPECKNRMKFLEDALGKTVKEQLLPTYYETEIEKEIIYQPMCG